MCIRDSFYCVVLKSFQWMCMRQNFKLFCCAAYILNLIVSICLSCWPNLWCSGVFSAEICSFRENSAKPDISRKYGSASRIFWKIRLRGLPTPHARLRTMTDGGDRAVWFGGGNLPRRARCGLPRSVELEAPMKSDVRRSPSTWKLIGCVKGI